MRRAARLAVPLGIGFAFLYLPILLMVLFSFNDSRLVTTFTGFSTRWYVALWENEALMQAAGLSLRIAAVSATMATVLGVIAGFALARMGRFRGRTAFAGAMAAPLVMPEVITGLSLLLMFVAMEQAFGFPAGRGADTVAIAHATFGAAYVAVVVQARLADFDTSLEEAAMDLGARPWKVFFLITLPLTAPAIAAGWLLAFTLSLDDLVIASFVSGPGASTLPMVIFSAVRLGLTPDLYALATLLVGLVAVGLVIASWIAWPRRRG
ncbi:ABC transporter permease subunit [Roseomonas stagni]|uniref:ABC transporter permease subunit n=1 Tax=Falsiroseomonas algicola TaxID=2716930 RepID=A0A6M1LIV7_9PROT|nr:ABC transporter permease subunit [Falsiroseomonas algicola]NGM19939.1 ABC transporter permease subunit [Falsiroseomonas algicola]